MRAKRIRQLALAAGASSFALAGASVVLIVLHPATDVWARWGIAGYDAAFALVFGAVGLLVTTRRPGNVVGWLFLASAVVAGAQAALTSYSQYAIVAGWAGSGIAAWISGWTWLPSLALIALIFMLFPDGRHVSPRWRRLAIALMPVTVAVTLLWALARPVDTTVADAAVAIDPLGIGPAHPLRTLAGVGVLILVAALLAGAVSLGVRMRRGDPTERQQIKWIAFAGAFLGPMFASSVLTTLFPVDPALAKATQLLAVTSVLLIPVAAGIAILRYRLYDIDVLINRTLVYGATTAAIAATFFLGILAVTQVIRPLTAGSELAVAASTLVSLALFQPIRRRVQNAVDQRFDRSRYDAARMLDDFADRLRDEVELDRLRDELLGAVSQTMAPAHSSLWLRDVPRNDLRTAGG